jgi:DNA-binding CsgD family transcriptional regulator
MTVTDLLLALLAAVVAEEALGLSETVSRWLVRRNARRLPPEMCESYEEEWLRHLEELHGSLSKLIFSLDLYRATYFIQREARRVQGDRSRFNEKNRSSTMTDEQIAVSARSGALTPREHLGGRLLTLRQLEVLLRICRGRTNKQVATELGLAEKTVKAHISAIFKVLGVVNRAQAVLVARRVGMITGDDDRPGDARKS